MLGVWTLAAAMKDALNKKFNGGPTLIAESLVRPA